MGKSLSSLFGYLLLLIPSLMLAQPDSEKGHFNLEAEHFYEQATRHHDAGALELAAKFYTDATSANPSHLASWYNLGLVHYELGNFGQAEQALDELFQHNPVDTSAYELYGLILFERKHFDRAIASFNLVIKMAPTDELYVNRALAYLATGRNKQALTDFGIALELNHGNFNACLGKGIALNGLGQHLLAINWFDRALDLRPGDKTALTNRAIAEFQAGEPPKAQESFREALSQSRDSKIFLARARCRLADGNLNDAWYDVKEALALAPPSADAFELLGEIELEKKDFVGAIDSFAAALDLQTDRTSCYFKRSKAYVQNGQFYDAIQDLYQVIEAEPFNEEAKVTLLELYKLLDQENLSVVAMPNRSN